MNDTHGVKGEGWYGFDLDGTLAKYDGWKGIDHIGEPVEPMVDLIKKMHDEGKVVKILTARIAPHKLEDGTIGESYITIPDGEGGAKRNYAHHFINDWCHFNLGFIPEIVYQKDHLMLELYDDRVKQVVPNKGLLIEEEWKKLRQKQEYLNVEQWIGGGFMGYEFLRQTRGWNPRKWIMSIRAKRAAFSDLRRISFGNPAKYERKGSN